MSESKYENHRAMQSPNGRMFEKKDSEERVKKRGKREKERERKVKEREDRLGERFKRRKREREKTNNKLI